MLGIARGGTTTSNATAPSLFNRMTEGEARGVPRMTNPAGGADAPLNVPGARLNFRLEMIGS